eukprot:EG_transcript_24217
MYSDCYDKFGRRVRDRAEGIVGAQPIPAKDVEVIDLDGDAPAPVETSRATPAASHSAARPAVIDITAEARPPVIDITALEEDEPLIRRRRTVVVPDDDPPPARRLGPRGWPEGDVGARPDGYKGKGRPTAHTTQQPYQPGRPVRQPVVLSNRYPGGPQPAPWHLGRGPPPARHDSPDPYHPAPLPGHGHGPPRRPHSPEYPPPAGRYLSPPPYETQRRGYSPMRPPPELMPRNAAWHADGDYPRRHSAAADWYRRRDPPPEAPPYDPYD